MQGSYSTAVSTMAHHLFSLQILADWEEVQSWHELWKSVDCDTQKLKEIITAVPACIEVCYSKPLDPLLSCSLNSFITYQKSKAYYV